MKNKLKKQLETAPSTKDLKIAEQLKRLRDFNQKGTDDDEDDDNNDDDDGFGSPLSLSSTPTFDLPLYNPPSPSIS